MPMSLTVVCICGDLVQIWFHTTSLLTKAKTQTKLVILIVETLKCFSNLCRNRNNK